MNYWLNLFSEESWQEFRQSGSDKSGFSPNRWRIVQKIGRGDYFLCYMVGGPGFFGILEVTGESFYDASPMWKGFDFASWVPVRIVLSVPRDHAVHIKTLHDMSWIRGKSPNYWKGRVAGSPARIEEDDAKIIIAALEEAQKKAIERKY